MHKISVIIPIYNVEQYLPKCIESVINQTYKNLEIILVDDGSPDKCPEICDEFAKKDGKIYNNEEYFMLALRLKSGIDTRQYEKSFGITLGDGFYKLAELLKSEKLVDYQKDRLWLTDKGMLLSNTIITEFLERIV